MDGTNMVVTRQPDEGEARDLGWKVEVLQQQTSLMSKSWDKNAFLSLKRGTTRTGLLTTEGMICVNLQDLCYLIGPSALTDPNS